MSVALRKPSSWSWCERLILTEVVEPAALAARRRSLEFNPLDKAQDRGWRLMGRSGPSNGLEPFRRPLAGPGERSARRRGSAVARGEAGGRATRRAGRRPGPGRQRPSWGWAAGAGRISQARLMEAAGWVWRGRKPGAGERRPWRASGLLATGMGKGTAEMSGPKRAHMTSRGDWRF